MTVWHVIQPCSRVHGTTDHAPWDMSSCAECAPGYYYGSNSSSSSSNGGTAAGSCRLCSKGSWCPGGRAAASATTTAAVRISCGAFLTTVSTGAVSPASCITQPGAAFMRGAGTAAACSPGSYNAGGNQRNCTSCPGEDAAKQRPDRLLRVSIWSRAIQLRPMQLCHHVACKFWFAFTPAVTQRDAYAGGCSCQCCACALCLCLFCMVQLACRRQLRVPAAGARA